eukprot:TRINITY_DN4321_c0_g1_i3.p1 TRINITY_DN4321_c0_g1~~TRINITY_DN4321_c0_g1_i3.p1  ORF type:complete len:316 (+),score=25.01 TRINITY_DN4321_c0_g1_i3:77-1024(+)
MVYLSVPTSIFHLILFHLLFMCNLPFNSSLHFEKLLTSLFWELLFNYLIGLKERLCLIPVWKTLTLLLSNLSNSIFTSVAKLGINIQVCYFWPLDDQAFKEFEKMWCKIINESGGRIVLNTIRVMFGRILEVPESCNGVARFTFDYLCGRPVGAADYIAVAKNYHTVFISDIPVMSMRIRDKARRFITLIDELYNHHCCLYCTAASSVDDLFQGTDEGPLFDLESFQFETEIEGGKLRRDVLAEGSMGSGAAPAGISSLLSGQEETFAFRRAVSRLIEMQTPLYLEGVQRLHPYFSKPNRELPSIGFNSLSQPAS